ncbi:MAG: hypothetical protein Q7U02_14380 [Desulfosalsimonadaceae bacterium]|nr:hypothetical protein [Desulfosalsimonadaceae bacterium]
MKGKMMINCFILLLIGLIQTYPPMAAAAENTPKEGGIVRLKEFGCVDTHGIGIEAFSLLMPSDWAFDGGINWVLDNPGMPAVAKFTVKNPKGAEAFEVFPNQAMFWTNNPMLLATFPIGSRYFGAEVRPVADPMQALTEIVLPRFRGNAEGLKVVSRKHLPELAKALGAGASQPGVRTFADAAKIRIEYTEGGVLMEEEIFAVTEGFSFAFQTMQGMITNTNWYVDYIFSFKTKKGDLDANSPLFQTMVNSFKVNPVWFNKYNQTVEYLIQAQIKNIRNIGELSRIISRTSNEISDSMMQSYENRQQVYDRISENFSEYVRGTEHYNNPIEGREVELPGGYSHAWTNAGGEYILTDNPNYNPNVGSNQNWEELPKK